MYRLAVLCSRTFIDDKMMNLAYDVFTPDNVIKELEPIIFIHGLIETRKTWLYIAPVIARNTRRTTYTIDCRNHGDSPWNGDYSSSVLSSDLEDFLKQHRIPKAVLVGHSMGAIVAMTFALRRPEMVEKLVVEDSPVQKSVHSEQNLVPLAMKYMKALLEELSKRSSEEEAFKYLFDLIRRFTPMMKVTENAVNNYDNKLLPFKWNGKALELQINLEALGDSSLNDKLVQEMSGVFEGEALFIWGGESQFKVGQDTSIFRHFPRSTRLKFENVGHFIHHTPEHQPKFIREVSQFINSARTAKL